MATSARRTIRSFSARAREWQRSKAWKCASISLRVGGSFIASMVVPSCRLATGLPSGVSNMACTPRLRMRRRQGRSRRHTAPPDFWLYPRTGSPGRMR